MNKIVNLAKIHFAMSGRKIIFYILGAFVAGALVLIYVEYNSTTHVNALIDANKKLLDESQITRNLMNVAKSKVIIERKTRGFIESGDTIYLAGLTDEFNEIATAQRFLLTVSDDTATTALIRELDQSVQLKINLFHRVLEAYRLHGIKTAEDTINANLPEWVSYDIETITRKISETRGRRLATINEAVQQSGKKALEFSYILLTLVLVAAAIIFWYIIYIIRKLIRSEKKVKETARIKENFLANMSHEIRTPMNAILGFTQILSQKKLDEETKYYVNTIQRSGENLLAIVNDILDISRIEAGMMRIEHVPFSLRGLVHSLEMMMRPRASSKGIRFTTETDPAIPDILEGDAVRLTQILSNLLGNALKFTSQGSIALRITPVGIHNHTAKLKIEISDTGIGIDPQKLGHIFGRFQQADDTITRQYGGTGLGLSIVKDLVELQHGTIEVESEAGAGTLFRVILPYTVSSQQITDNLALSESRLPATTGIRILVTEDNELNQSLLSHIFKNWGLAFDIAGHGQEAIGKLKTGKYDLVLMDIQMPVMDGYTAARYIRNELKSAIPIIAMTAHAMPGEKEKCLSYGMNDYIAKPIKQEQLSQLISRFTRFTEPGAEKEETAPSLSGGFHYIRLHYLKEVSGGDIAYEKDMARKFLEAVPVTIQELQSACNEGDREKIKRVAHHLKSTIAVMGLNEWLEPLLDEAEAGQGPCGELVTEISDRCNKAAGEAKRFLATLQ